MNEEELQLLVARARAEEGTPSHPPPGLVDDARTAARHRRRIVSVAAALAVATVVLGGVTVPRLLGDEDPGSDEPLSRADSGELAAHGGPCPSELPAPIDDEGGHGFGTSTPAERDPRFGTPDSAWVCRYVAESVGRTESGTVYEWRLSETPRRLDDARLGPVDAGLAGIAVDDPGLQTCTADLGPRWVLITSAGGDLTGVVVDGYGCRNVRLTDDPFVTAPGDPQVGGTVPGVLSAGDDFAGNVETWWNTSPADAEAGPTPDELRVTCTDDGPAVEATRVAAQPAGVVVEVGSTMPDGSYLTYASAGLSGGDDLSQMLPSTTYAFPPGPVTLGCASSPGMDETATVTVDVTDPHGYWRSATLEDFGCSTDRISDWIAVSGEGSTPEEAVEGLLTDFAAALDRDRADYTAQAAPTGYSGAATQTWIALRRGAPDFSINVTQTSRTFTATPDIDCT